MPKQAMLIDLHSHSNISDGSLPPSELAAKAAEAGIKTLALTDHDTIEGLDEAADAARAFGITLVRGVELEIEWPLTEGGEGREFHLLGLGIDEPSEELQNILAELRCKRERRNALMLEKLHDIGVEAALCDINAGQYIGRPHFAAYLVHKKVVKNYDEAFKKYLSRGGSLFVPKGGIELRRAASAIKESGAFSIIAHPNSLYVAWGKMEAFFELCKNEGVDGIEAYHPNIKIRASERFVKLAEKLSFCVSAGSDFHGEGRKDRKLGRSGGGAAITKEKLKFPKEILEKWGIDAAAAN